MEAEDKGEDKGEEGDARADRKRRIYALCKTGD